VDREKKKKGKGGKDRQHPLTVKNKGGQKKGNTLVSNRVDMSQIGANKRDRDVIPNRKRMRENRVRMKEGHWPYPRERKIRLKITYSGRLDESWLQVLEERQREPMAGG